MPLFTHIRHMLWTTVPSIVIALGLYALFGMGSGGDGDAERIRSLIDGLRGLGVERPTIRRP